MRWETFGRWFWRGRNPAPNGERDQSAMVRGFGPRVHATAVRGAVCSVPRTFYESSASPRRLGIERSAFLQFQAADDLFGAGRQAPQFFGQLRLFRNAGFGGFTLDVPHLDSTVAPSP